MTEKKLLISENKLTSNEIENLLKEMDCQFDVPLSSYIDLSEWSKKLAKYARFCMCSNKKGLIAYYTNEEHKSAYITLV